MPSYILVLIMMLPLGFGVAIIDAGLNTYIASMPRNAALLNFLHAFYGTGALLGPVVASALLAMKWGWNSVYIVWIGMSLVLLIGFSFGPIYPTTIALISNKVPGRILPSAIGFMVSLGSVGAAVCPWLAGMLAEHVGLWSLMPYVIILTAAMVLLWQVRQVRPKVPQTPLKKLG